MKKIIAYIFFAFSVVLAGCASTSGSVGLQNGSTDKIIEGKTTIAEVRALLGEPANAFTDGQTGGESLELLLVTVKGVPSSRARAQ